nr:ribosomal protein S10 [Microheliella maris]BDN85880.1 ribosomal protein S10 [Microheliella maris]
MQTFMITYQIQITSYNNYILENFYQNFLNENYVKQTGLISIPTRKQTFTLLRSPHVHKKARDQFQYSRAKKLWQVTGTPDNLSNFIKTLKLNLPPLISLKIIKMT